VCPRPVECGVTLWPQNKYFSANNMKRLNCFIAMAFGRADCDVLYQKKILPVIKSLNLNPIRVDKQQHKDDLNVFIVRKLKESHIALVDLTYARPSVYYEAGYAERNIPVIYTVRKDHLSRKQQDDNIRVHFDLEMKKIIDWSSPNDNIFSKKLNDRFSYLLKPIWREMEINDEYAEERRIFKNKSLFQRLDCIEEIATKQLKSKHYYVVPLGEVSVQMEYLVKPIKVIIGLKLKGNLLDHVIIAVGESFTERQIDLIINKMPFIKTDTPLKIKNISSNFFLYSLNRMRKTRIMKMLPSGECVDDTQDNCIIEIGKDINCHLLTPIDCERDAMLNTIKAFKCLNVKKPTKHIKIIKGYGYSATISFTSNSSKKL
jgi:hypothetical protein